MLIINFSVKSKLLSTFHKIINIFLCKERNLLNFFLYKEKGNVKIIYILPFFIDIYYCLFLLAFNRECIDAIIDIHFFVNEGQ